MARIATITTETATSTTANYIYYVIANITKNEFITTVFNIIIIIFFSKTTIKSLTPFYNTTFTIAFTNTTVFTINMIVYFRLYQNLEPKIINEIRPLLLMVAPRYQFSVLYTF